MLIGVTHLVSPHIRHCELTWRERECNNYERAAQEQQAYCSALARCDVQVIALAANSESYPDSCFVQDAAIVTDELAIVARMGAPSRRGETLAIERALTKYRRLARITPPATLDGGDCIISGKHVFLGMSAAQTPMLLFNSHLCFNLSATT